MAYACAWAGKQHRYQAKFDILKIMGSLETFYLLSLITQLVHSVEELSTSFHKKWYLFKMPFWVFLTFEILFSLFWIVVLMLPTSSYKISLQVTFLLLMFANGIQHLVWWGNVKKYVPGLITAFIHVAIGIFYFIVIKS